MLYSYIVKSLKLKKHVYVFADVYNISASVVFHCWLSKRCLVRRFHARFLYFLFQVHLAEDEVKVHLMAGSECSGFLLGV